MRRNNFFVKVNSVHVNIQFTKQYNNITIIFRCVSYKFDTSVFWKRSSLRPIKYKRNLFKCRLERANHISSSYKVLHVEFYNITDMLLRIGYPLYFIQNQIS